MLYGDSNTYVLGEEGIAGLNGEKGSCSWRWWSVWYPVRVLLRDAVLLALWTDLLLGLLDHLHHLRHLLASICVTGCLCRRVDVRI